LGSNVIELRQNEQVRALAETAMRNGRMTLVFSAGDRMSRKWRHFAAEIGALTTQCSVPFIESEFALDSWIMALQAEAAKESFQ